MQYSVQVTWQMSCVRGPIGRTKTRAGTAIDPAFNRKWTHANGVALGRWTEGDVSDLAFHARDAIYAMHETHDLYNNALVAGGSR